MAGRNRDQIELVTEELEDLSEQVRAGDMDEATAESLRDKYVAELDRLIEERTLVTEADQPLRDSGSQAPLTHSARLSPLKGGRGRAFVGMGIVAVAVAVIAVFAVNSLSGPSTAGAEGVVGDVITGEGSVDLSTVSDEEMEAVVAQNPEVIGMRLALARRYFDAGDLDLALDHYMIILNQERHPEALVNVGWMTYLSGRPDVALGYIEAALQRQPGSLTATWFLGNIQYTLGNYEDAAEALTTIIEADGVPDDVKESARLLITQMEEG